MTNRTLAPPHNIEAEQSVLGSLLIDPEALDGVLEMLQAEDFYRDAHQVLYAAMRHLHQQRLPVDVITLSDLLEQQEQLDTVGGPGYLVSLLNVVPTSGNVLAYARIVERTTLLRRLIAAGSKIVALASAQDEDDASATLEQAEQVLFQISQRFRGGSAQSTHVRDILAEYLEQLKRSQGLQGTLPGIPTGFSELDRLLGGLHPSDLIILAGRPGMGKSALALSLAHHAACHAGRKVGLFSLEMSREQVVQRLLAMETGVAQTRLRNGWVEDDDWEQLVDAMGRMGESTLWIDDRAALSPTQMCSRARQWASTEGVELLIVDYLQLMSSSTPLEGRPSRNREQEVASISRALKAMARELHLPVVALAQLSRAVESRENKRPQLSDLRESGAIEADSDVVLLLYRDDAYHQDSERPNTAEVIVAKQRNGPVGLVSLAFDKAQTHFRDRLSMVPTAPQPTVPFSDEGDDLLL